MKLRSDFRKSPPWWREYLSLVPSEAYVGSRLLPTAVSRAFRVARSFQDGLLEPPLGRVLVFTRGQGEMLRLVQPTASGVVYVTEFIRAKWRRRPGRGGWADAISSLVRDGWRWSSYL